MWEESNKSSWQCLYLINHKDYDFTLKLTTIVFCFWHNVVLFWLENCRDLCREEFQCKPPINIRGNHGFDLGYRLWALGYHGLWALGNRLRTRRELQRGPALGNFKYGSPARLKLIGELTKTFSQHDAWSQNNCVGRSQYLHGARVKPVSAICSGLSCWFCQKWEYF